MVRWLRCVAWMEEIRNAHSNLVRKPGRKGPLRRCRCRWNSKLIFKDWECGLALTGSACNLVVGSCDHGKRPPNFIEDSECSVLSYLPVLPKQPVAWASSTNTRAPYSSASLHILSRGAMSPSIENTPSVTINLSRAFFSSFKWCSRSKHTFSFSV